MTPAMLSNRNYRQLPRRDLRMALVKAAPVFRIVMTCTPGDQKADKGTSHVREDRLPGWDGGELTRHGVMLRP